MVKIDKNQLFLVKVGLHLQFKIGFRLLILQHKFHFPYQISLLVHPHDRKMNLALMRKKLIIASNRLPFKIEKRNGVYEISHSAGGLVSALNSFIDNYKQLYEIVWVGCPDFNMDTWLDNQHLFRKNDYEIHPVFIHRKKEKSLFYNGFCNSTIWPLFHYFPSLAEFSEEEFIAYRKVNKLFADEILKIAKANDVVWIHDYHLMLLPALLRGVLQGLQIGFFLHIPFPSHELYKLLPQEWRDELLYALIQSDMIGFQTKDYVNHFLFTLSYFTGIGSSNGAVFYNGHLCRAKDYPISIDYNRFYNAYDLPAVKKGRRTIQEKYKNIRLIFSVDRLDYTKGILNRLLAFEKLLEEHAIYKERVVFLLNMVPSRDSISQYSQRKKTIEENISRINGKHGHVNWQPIIYQYRHLSFTQLLTFYTSCHVALITPLRDGMNLVAKEFIASRADQKGVLILSEMAGAVNELELAVIVNPTDVGKIKESIITALEMPEQQQKKRMMIMQDVISENNIEKWLETYMGDLNTIYMENKRLLANVMSFTDRNSILDNYQKAQQRLILLDYDGTLTDFAQLPEQASPSQQLLQLIGNLSSKSNNRVCIISGRKSDELEKWFNGLNVILVAEHGCTYKLPSGEWLQMLNFELGWKTSVNELLQKFVTTHPGSFVEDKIYSVAWHYRAAQEDVTKHVLIDIKRKLSSLHLSNAFTVVQGSKVIEVKSAGMNKGLAVQKLLASNSFDFVLAIGDDTTDEDMFEILNAQSHVTIKVGVDKSKAKFNLIGITNVLSFLNQLTVVG